MTVRHPYISATGAVAQVLSQLRKQFPTTVDASTLKKYNIAPNNESYLINLLKFLGIIDDSGQQLAAAKAIFLRHNDDEFAEGLAELIVKSYKGLFDLYGSDAWIEPTDRLISYFRQTDETSDVIGTRQARTFAVLAAFAKKRDGASAQPKKISGTPKTTPKLKATTKPKIATQTPTNSQRIAHENQSNGLTALTVRIEVNLPAGGDQSTYDAIFKSIRANLM